MSEADRDALIRMAAGRGAVNRCCPWGTVPLLDPALDEAFFNRGLVSGLPPIYLWNSTIMPNPSSATRTARWRERRQRGAFIMSVEVDSDVVARLLDEGYLEGRTNGSETRVTKADIAAAVQNMLDDYADG